MANISKDLAGVLIAIAESCIGSSDERANAIAIIEAEAPKEKETSKDEAKS